MIGYPKTFKVKASSAAGKDQVWSSKSLSHDQDIRVAIPPEFDGPGGGVSPEDLYAMSLQSCFLATFKVMAERSKIDYRNIDVESMLTVDRDEKGQPWMASVQMKVRVEGGGEEDQIRKFLERVPSQCFILNSVKTRITFEFSCG